MQSWREAWQAALYGPAGFYRDPAGPAGHFATACHGPVGAALAGTVLGLAEDVGARSIIDLGAGRGELLVALRSAGFEGPLTGVDVVGRPPGLPADVGWVRSPGGADLPSAPQSPDSLVLAHEWLDVVPCTIAEVDDQGLLRTVLVDAAGRETLGGRLSEPEQDWARRWWPAAATGSRVEVGLARDEAWSSLLDRWRPRAAVAVDYGHTLDHRPAHGTLTGYREGHQVATVPDGRRDLTAHVAVDSLRQTTRMRGGEAVTRWGPGTAAPDPSAAATDPRGYLDQLAAASGAATLAGHPFGRFWWVVSA